MTRDGTAAARRWYWRQVAGFGARRKALEAARAEEVASGLHGPEMQPGGGPLSPGAWLRDLRLALRGLRRQPGFAALAIATLALGIGANTAIFSVLHGSLLRPLPYPDPDTLLWLSDSHPNFDGAGANQSVPNLVDIQATTRQLESLAIYKTRSDNMTTATEPERVTILYASHELLGTLGLPVRLGRDLQPEDDSSGGQPVAILTDRMWRERFEADPAVIGQTVEVGARPVLIVGVADPAFYFRGDPQLIMGLQHMGTEHVRGNRGHFSVGRIAEGSDLETVNAELAALYAALGEEHPDANEGWSAVGEPLADVFVGRNRASLYLMAGAVVMVLLIACVNVANLMLVRAESRSREFAVRYSLGATRRGLLPLFLSEGMVLSGLGGIAGIVAAVWGVDLLVNLYGGSLARATDIHVSATALGFGLAVSLVVGLAIGLVPLARSNPDQVHETLKEGARGSAAGRGRLGRALVVVEVALAVLIVAGAGLLIHSVWRLQAVDLGLDGEEQVLTFRVSLPNAIYNNAPAVDSFHRGMLDGLGRIPGVEAAAIVNRLPLLGGDNTGVRAFDDPTNEAHFVSYRMVDGSYLEAAGLRLIAGRWLDADDLTSATPSVVINENLARQLFPGRTAVGERLMDAMLPPGTPGAFDDGLEIVGVVSSVVSRWADAPAPAAYYYSFARALDMLARYPELLANESIGTSVMVRTRQDPHSLVADVRRAVSTQDAAVPIYEIRTLEELALDRLGTRGFAMSLFGVFAGLAPASGRHRDLRGHVVRRYPARPRARRADGPRRGSQARDAHGSQRGCEADAARARPRATRRPGGEPDARPPAVRGQRARPRDLRRGRGRSRPGLPGRGVLARAPGHARRPDDLDPRLTLLSAPQFAFLFEVRTSLDHPPGRRLVAQGGGRRTRAAASGSRTGSRTDADRDPRLGTTGR